MKNECEIVKDLLFSYNDGVLRNASKEFVEEHIKNCDDCRKDLEEIKQESKALSEKKEIDYLKDVKRKINKKNIIITISLCLLTVFIIFNVLVFKKYNEVASTMEIFLKDDITDEELEKIKNKILEIGNNVELEYVSKEKALEQLNDKIKEKEYLLDGYNNENNKLSAYFEIKTDVKKIDEMVKSIEQMDGVKTITTHLGVNPYALYIRDYIK